jgi:hypothetical protein
MPSDRYLQLQAQLSILRTHLLPNPFEETGLYTDEEKVATTALAYRVLAMSLYISQPSPSRSARNVSAAANT